METVATRIPEDEEEVLAQMEEDFQTDRSNVLRQLISQGLEEYRLEKALEELREHKVTLRKAADIAGVTYVEMLTEAAEAGIDVGYTTEDLERDLDRI